MNTKLLAIPMLLLAVSLAAPAVSASNHTAIPDDVGDDDDIEDDQEDEEEVEVEIEEEEDDDESDDEVVSFNVTEAEAQSIAEAELPNGTWTLEESERDDDGYYEFEFLGANGEDEAEVAVNGVTGAIRSFNVEVEEDEADDEDVEENETEEQNVSTLEEARERIEELREQVQELRAQVQELRANNSARDDLPEQASDRAREAQDRRGPPEGVPGQARGQEAEQEVEIEAEQENGDREVEVEAERRGPSQQARDNVNGTPGNSENRPNFVTRMLQSMFS